MMNSDEIQELVWQVNNLEAERDILQEENTRLRAALAHSELPCVYCTLPAEDWAKCEKGFPGCGRGDDALGCPHLGASLELYYLEKRLKDNESV